MTVSALGVKGREVNDKLQPKRDLLKRCQVFIGTLNDEQPWLETNG